MVRLANVGIGERLEHAREELKRATGGIPDGIVLLGDLGEVELLDGGACRLLQLDPRRTLGEVLNRDVLEGLDFFEGEGFIGLFSANEAAPFPAGSGEPVNWLLEVMGFEELDDVLVWIGDYLDERSGGLRGGISLRDGDTMALWAAWPLELGILMPLRFPVTESRAFRTGQRSYGREHELVSGDDVTVAPVIVNGTVIGLVAWEGQQEAVEDMLPHLGMVLSRFTD